ncbi:MAG: 5-bromo-4-chloroindolyl phosphate hydrolysis family protein, partial [Selenomonadaceae bacterium]|nr:5-bromo-4-chloroindolyl phosphate hydrolysis family protein [Selenomonadaceae bacterium]
MSGWKIAGLVCFAAALVEGWQGQTSAAVGTMVLAIGCAGVALARRPRTQAQRIAALSAEQLAAVPAEEQALATELYEKAQRDYLAVEQARHAVKDERLARALAALQPVSARIMGYLRQHPEKIPLARKFIDYYQDRAAQLAAEYQELEATGLVTPQVEETKRHIREVVASFGQVYTASFEKLLTDKLLDVDAELKVMEQTLDAEGIERVPEAQTADGASPEEQAQAGEPAAAGAAQAAGEYEDLQAVGEGLVRGTEKRRGHGDERADKAP